MYDLITRDIGNIANKKKPAILSSNQYKFEISMLMQKKWSKTV